MLYIELRDLSRGVFFGFEMAMIKKAYLLDIDADLNYCFVETTAEAIGHANFLARTQLEFDSASERRIHMGAFTSVHKRLPVNYIFHTAFCGSTLLSRALHNPPHVVSLKEPHVLFRLSEASLRLGDEYLAPHVNNVMAELSQPWTSDGQVVIKPTNSCNIIISNLVMSDDKVLFLYSTLESFLISCLKKCLSPKKESIGWRDICCQDRAWSWNVVFRRKSSISLRHVF